LDDKLEMALAYADDLCFVIKNRGNLSRIIRIIEQEGETLNLKLN
jgi:hypothetical protein